MGRGLRCCVVVSWGVSSVDAGVVSAGDAGTVEGSLEGNDELADEGGDEAAGKRSSPDPSGDESSGRSEEISCDWSAVCAAEVTSSGLGSGNVSSPRSCTILRAAFRYIYNPPT
jgi:hypothetical protein